MFAENVSYPAAFLAGLISFFSPCILPLIPAYFTFITGFSLDELVDDSQQDIRQKVIFSTIFYVTGFSVVFVLLGASASYLGNLLYHYKDFIRIIGGMIIIIFGIHLIGLIRIKFLDIEKRIHLKKRPVHLLGAFLVGIAFGLGWSPCIGPLLGSILVIAGSQETVGQGMVLLGIYSAGLAIPFIILSLFIHLLIRFVQKATRAVRLINTSAGILLIILGLLLVTNKLKLLSVSV
jgi:cytochrome c-type biogenesis protein